MVSSWSGANPKPIFGVGKKNGSTFQGLLPSPSEPDFEFFQSIETMKNMARKQHSDLQLCDSFLLKDHQFTSHRELLVQWITNICSSLPLLPVTLHLAVSLFDARLLVDRSLPRSGYQLAAASSVFVAAKFHENLSTNLLDLELLSHLTEKFFSADDILIDEARLLEAISFRVNLVTTSSFLSVLSGVVAFQTEDTFSEHIRVSAETGKKIRKRIIRRADYFASMTLHAYGFKKYLPFVLAASCLTAARDTLGIRPIWSERLGGLLQLDFNAIQNCFLAILRSFHMQRHLQGKLIPFG